MDAFISILVTTRAAAEAAIVASNYASAVKNATNSYKTLSQELSSIQKTLENIDGVSRILQQKVQDLDGQDPKSNDSSSLFLVPSSPSPSTLNIPAMSTTTLTPSTSPPLTTHEKACIESLLALTGGDGQLKQLTHTLEEIQVLLRTGKPETAMKLRQRILWPLQVRQSKVLEYIGRLERYKTHLSLVLNMISTHKIERIEQTTYSILDGQRRLSSEYLTGEKVRRRQELITWLNPIQHNVKHEQSLKLRQKGTCNWLLENDYFNQWRSGSNFLWLHGIPGSGKTVLTSTIIQELKNEVGTMVAYHYCNFNDSQSTSASSVLCSLFTQLLSHAKTDWLLDFEDLAERKSFGEGPPTYCLDLIPLIARAAQYHSKIVFIVDALDECLDNEELLSCLPTLTSSYHISVLVTSRAEQAIYDAFHDLPTLSLEHYIDQIDEDLRKHVAEQLRSQPKLSRYPDNIKEEIASTLLSHGDGLFRWVQYQLDVLATCRTPKGVSEVLRNLPQGLNERVLI